MTEQEQIEEIARKICIFTHHWKRYKTCKECFEANEYACQSYRNCKAFIEEGYRKLPEDSVVLSKEEFSKALTDNFNMGKKEAQFYSEKVAIPTTRKETAEKIYTKIKDSFLMNINNRYALKLWIEEQFGLEIKE